MKLTKLLTYSYISKSYIVFHLKWSKGRNEIFFRDPANALMMKAFNFNKTMYFVTDEEAKQYE